MIITSHSQKQKGFTLTELLVVIMIMVILMGVGGLSMMQNSGGRGLSSGASTIQAAINEARTLAMSRGTEARLLIYDDKSSNDDMESYRRKLITVYKNDDENWEAAYRAVSLPANVFFDAGQTVYVTGGGLGTVKSGASFDFPGGAKVASACLYIQFNKLGICTDSVSGATAGASFTLVSGRISGNSVLPNGESSNGTEKIGVVVWRNGGTTTVTDIDKISGDTDL